MVSLQMINAREAPLTDSAAKVLLGGLHVGPSGRKGRSGVNKSVRERKSLGGGEKKEKDDEGRSFGGGWYYGCICIGCAEFVLVPKRMGGRGMWLQFGHSGRVI
jgi:hypothetical protein